MDAMVETFRLTLDRIARHKHSGTEAPLSLNRGTQTHGVSGLTSQNPKSGRRKICSCHIYMKRPLENTMPCHEFRFHRAGIQRHRRAYDVGDRHMRIPGISEPQ